jgi:hypothetical protein
VNWMCNFIIVEITPYAITNIGWKTYVIFAVLNFTWAPLLYFFYSETARKSMEEIDNLFLDKKIDYQAGHVVERPEIDNELFSEVREDVNEKDHEDSTRRGHQDASLDAYSILLLKSATHTIPVS